MLRTLGRQWEIKLAPLTFDIIPTPNDPSDSFVNCKITYFTKHMLLTRHSQSRSTPSLSYVAAHRISPPPLPLPCSLLRRTGRRAQGTGTPRLRLWCRNPAQMTLGLRITGEGDIDNRLQCCPSLYNQPVLDNRLQCCPSL